MRNYKYWGGECLTSSLFNIQRFAYKIVQNPYTINPIKHKAYNTKADLLNLVNLDNYALKSIQNYQTITEIPQEHLNYLKTVYASSAKSMFNWCDDLKSIPNLGIHMEYCSSKGVTSFLYGLIALEKADISWIPFENMISIASFFGHCRVLKTENIVGIENIRKANLTDPSSVSGLFYDAGNIVFDDRISLNSWKISGNQKLDYTFHNSIVNRKIDISNWKINATNCNGTFYDYDHSKEEDLLEEIDMRNSGRENLRHIEGVIDFSALKNQPLETFGPFAQIFISCTNLENVQLKNMPDVYYSDKEGFLSITHLNRVKSYNILS